MSVQDDFLKLVKDNKYIFKEITDKAGESEKVFTICLNGALFVVMY